MQRPCLHICLEFKAPEGQTLPQIISLNSFTHDALDKMNIKMPCHGEPSQGQVNWGHQKQMAEPGFFFFSTKEREWGLVCSERPALPKEEVQDGPGAMAPAANCLLTTFHAGHGDACPLFKLCGGGDRGLPTSTCLPLPTSQLHQISEPWVQSETLSQ